MAMVGPSNPFGQGVLGISPMDCGDWNPDSISFAFLSANDSYSASLHGIVIAHELAHALGLDHVNDPDDLMNPSVSPNSNPAFKDECIALVDAACGPHPDCDSGSQNDYAELMGLFGPSSPDVAPPTVEITYPHDGDAFDVGADFTLTVEADDDKGVKQVDLYSNGSKQSTDSAAPWSWDVQGIPEGSYEFHVVAMDDAGNETTSDTVHVEVGAGGQGEGEDENDGDPGDDGDDGDDGTEPYDPGDGSLPPGYGGPEQDRDLGCGCAASPRAPWLLLLMGLPLVRRRVAPRTTAT
jgi:MYXO-CTERM domain-containing protein